MIKDIKNMFEKKKTLLWNNSCACFDQSLSLVMVVEATQISTPLDNVPLYKVQPSIVSMMLLKSSHAVSSSE